MTKQSINENKGEVHFAKQDWQYYLDIDYNYDHNCFDYGCDDEGICRCGTIYDAHVEPLTPSVAASIVHQSFTNGSGEAGKLGLALAIRLFQHGLKYIEDMFEVNTCSGYYGEEIESVEIVDNAAWEAFQKEIVKFNSSSNSERLRQVLEIEYGHVLPEVDQYKEWALMEIPVAHVKASPDVLGRTNEETVQNYREMTPWFYSHNSSYKRLYASWFPGVVVIPKSTNEWRLIDGFHRFKAWTTKPQHMSDKKWKRLRKNKKLLVIAPVV